MAEADVETLMALDLEYRLTIAYRIDCECAPYFTERREVLMPAILRKADELDEDPVDVLAEYARKVHAKRCSTPNPSRGNAVMALIALMSDVPTTTTTPVSSRGSEKERDA